MGGRNALESAQHTPCAKRRSAWRRLRPAHAGKAAPRPSQAPSGPRPPQPSLARSQASGVGPLPAGWSEGLTTGRRRGTDTSPGQVLSEVLCCAQHSASKQELGGSPKNRVGRVPVADSNCSWLITFISAKISKKYCNYLPCLLLTMAGCGITNARLMTTAAGRPRRW